MAWDIWMFLTVLVFVFALVMVIAGIFSAYFGTGKNRTYGIIITIVGLAVGIFWEWLTVFSGISPFCDMEVWTLMYDGLIYLIAILIGALIAVGIFLATVLKS